MRRTGWKGYGVGFGAAIAVTTAIVLVSGWGTAVAAQVTNVFVSNDAAHAVPVHEQGTANVSVTNTALSVRPKLPEAANAFFAFGLSSSGGHGETQPLGKTIDLSYIDVAMNDTSMANLNTISFSTGPGTATLDLPGPSDGAEPRDYRLALTQPIRADRIQWFCVAPGCRFTVDGIGTEVSP
jgi:hypothetical protein